MVASCAFPRGEPAAGRLALRRALTAALVLAACAAPARAQRHESALGLLLSDADPCSQCIENGVRLALDELAASPSADPLSLRIGRVESPWHSAAERARDLVLQEGCIALIAPPDREVAHLAAQVATKLRVPLVTLSPDSTLTRAKSPWIFRLVPDDRAQIRALLEALPRKPARVAALVPEGRAGSPVRADLQFLAGELGIEFDPVLAARIPTAVEPLALLGGRRGEPLLVWLPETQSLPLLEAAGSLGWEGPVLTPGLAHGDLAPPPCAGLNAMAVRLGGGRNPGDVRFRESFLQTTGSPPDGLAACAYDAAWLLARAARRGGSDAEAIRSALVDGGVHAGASGPVRLDATGNRLGPWHLEPPPPTSGLRPDGASRPLRSTGATHVVLPAGPLFCVSASVPSRGRSRDASRTPPGHPPASSSLASLLLP